MKLYELTQGYLGIRRLLDEGQPFEQALADISEEFENKVESVAMMVRELEAESTAFQDEAKLFSDKAGAVAQKVASLKNYLSAQMQLTGKDKVIGKLLKVSLQNSPPSCAVIDEALIPVDFIRVIPERREPDRKAILNAYKEGASVPGTEIIIGKHIVIR